MLKTVYDKVIEPVMSLAAPWRCTVCGDILSEKEVAENRIMCSQCILAMPLVTDFENTVSRLLDYLGKGEIALDGAFGMINLKEGGEFISAVYALKYRKYRRVGKILGEMLGRHILQAENFPRNADLIVPVPLHPARLRSRGFNQAEEIAEGIAEIFGNIVISSGAVRLVNTRTQTELGGKSRIGNVSNIFSVGAEHEFAGKNILIVDDIFTTGATTNSLARCLKQAGATGCYAVTVATA